MEDFPFLRTFCPSFREMFSIVCRDVRESSDTGDTTRPTTVARTLEHYFSSDAVSQHLSEPMRITSRTVGFRTALEIWMQEKQDIIASTGGNNRDRRNAVYLRGKEPSIFNPVFGGILLRRWSPVLTNIRILDPSAGWGDRLISALSLEDSSLGCYHGFDPNVDLQTTYSEIIRYCSPINVEDVFVKCLPFEDAPIVDSSYDLVITSPPFFTLEEYSDSSTQSISRFKTYPQWLKGFFIPYITKAFNALKKEGVMIIYISNFTVGGTTFKLEEETRRIVESLGGKLVMTDFFQGSSGGKRPTHIFKRKKSARD